MKTNYPITHFVMSLLCAVALFAGGLNGTVKAGIEGSKIAPPKAHPYGQSMAEWMSQYEAWPLIHAYSLI